MKPWHSLLGYTRREDGTFAKTIVLEWGITRKNSATEILVRSRSGRLLRVERSAAAKAAMQRWRTARDTTPKERLPYKSRKRTETP